MDSQSTTAPFSEDRRPTLGQPVSFTACLRQCIRLEGLEVLSRQWEIRAASGSGIYIGFRREQSGYTRYNVHGSEWTSTGNITCALVITTELDNTPVFVPFSHLFPGE